MIENDKIIKYKIDEDGNIITGGSKPDVKEQKKCHDRDCESKKLILNVLLENPMTSKQLWNAIQYQYEGKYKTFTSLLVRYQKFGYIIKHGKRPFIYELTPFGVENAKFPQMMRNEQKKRYMQHQINSVGALLNESPETLSQLVSQLSGQNIGGYGVGGSGGSDARHTSSDFGDSGDYHKIDAEKQENAERITQLEQENAELYKENTNLIIELAEQKKVKMVVNQSPTQPQKESETKKSNGRRFDSILRAYNDSKMDYSAYKQLPKQIVKIIVMPKGNIADDIKRLFFRKDVGGYIVVPDYTVSTLVKLGFCEPLTAMEIESLTMRFIEGNVYLVSKLGKFRITEVPKSKPQPQQKVRINAK